MTASKLAVDADAVSVLMREAAVAEVLPRFGQLEPGDIATKSGPDDLVTAADLGCEAFLTPRLESLLPGSRVVGEEAVAADPSQLDWLNQPGDVWVIDPVDGTHNFANGRPDFVVIVALVRDGSLLGGWIHAPLLDKTYAAMRGEGAYCDGRKLQVATPAPLTQMHAVMYVGPKKFPALYARVKATRDELGPRSYSRSAGMEYVGLIEGRVHYAMFTRQLPWDHGAGWLLHREAGGYGAYLDGTPYTPVAAAEPYLLAPDLNTWQLIRDFYSS
jgi:fructose-1,6-bisphosphatase/inositol monophosphatase family enzyme